MGQNSIGGIMKSEKNLESDKDFKVIIKDVPLLLDDLIKQQLVSKISEETYFGKIKLLSRFLALVQKNDGSITQIDPWFSSLAPEKVTVLSRHIKDLIFLHTPRIEFRSKDQVKILQNIIVEVAHHIPLQIFSDPEDPEGEPAFEILDRFNFLIDNKSVVKKLEGTIPKAPGISLPKNVKSADIIRMLLSKMAYFNDSYQKDNLDLKLWLHYLFIDTEGFSLNHILNASNRDSKSI